MLGVDAPVSLLVVREILVQGLLAVLLAFAVYPLIRRVLRPALVDYVRRCRRAPRRRAGRGAHAARPRRRARGGSGAGAR